MEKVKKKLIFQAKSFRFWNNLKNWFSKNDWLARDRVLITMYNDSVKIHFLCEATVTTPLPPPIPFPMCFFSTSSYKFLCSSFLCF